MNVTVWGLTPVGIAINAGQNRAIDLMMILIRKTQGKESMRTFREMDKFLAFLRENGVSTKVDDFLLVEMSFPANRYIIDNLVVHDSCSWMQIDTDEDASYFGVWCSPLSLEFLQYAEADWLHMRFTDKEAYNKYIKKLCDRYKPDSYMTVIDPDSGLATKHYSDRSSLYAT